MYYSEEIVEEVRSRSDIVDVISGYVKLQKKGNNYFGLCPFHNEKTPSFSVSPGKQMYYCFGCGAGGNVLTFLMEYENLTFPEALRLLADRAGVELPREEPSREEKAREDLRSALLEVHKQAANYYYYTLKQPSGRQGYEYLTGRGLTESTIRHFGLGYAAKTGSGLYRYLRGKGYGDEILKESGLVILEERGSRDRFWNRVMFPIMDARSRVVAFGGRVMGEGEPKYLNSPETKIFDKSRNLYGLNFARTSRESELLLCEGYMDVIAMHQAGFTNAVASLGTAFTSQHAMILKRYTSQVILAYDSDEAGVKAALRAIPVLKEAGIPCKVLDMKPYKDPDEFIKSKGADAFRERIAGARNSFLFEIDVMRQDCDWNDPEQQTRFYHGAARKLLEFSDALERDTYMKAVAREQMIDYGDLRQLVNRLALRIEPGSVLPGSGTRGDVLPGNGVREGALRGSALPGSGARGDILPGSGGAGQSAGGERRKGKESAARQSQRLLLTWLIEDPSLYEKIKGILTPDDFREELYHQVAEMVFEGCEKGDLNPARILSHFIDDQDRYKEVAELFHTTVTGTLNSDEQKKAFEETVIRVRKNSLDEAGRAATDISQLQEIIKAQSALKTLHISFD